MKYKVGDYVKIKQSWYNIMNASGSFGGPEYFVEKSGVVTEINAESPFIIFDFAAFKVKEKKDEKYYKVFLDKFSRYEIIDEKDMEKLA